MMTTDQSLNKLFRNPEWHKYSGINESTARVYKKRFREGKLNLETKMRLLEQSGFKLVREMQWEEQTGFDKIRNELIAKLHYENAFWSYHLEKDEMISDEKLIEMVLLHLDIEEIKSLFSLFPKKQIQTVWKEKMVSQEPFYHGLNRLYAFLFFGIKHPDRYIRDSRNTRI
jgi:hypothetical protein